MVRIVGEVLGLDRRIVAPLRTEVFEREQRRVINDKLVQKITELEEVCAERQLLVDQLLRAHEDVCRQLAEQLHDDPIQAVVAAGMRLEMLMRRLSDPEDREAVERIQVTIRAATSRLRAMVFALVPSELESQGLAVALRAYLGHALESDGLRTTLYDRTTREAPEATRTLLYRMAQEALANVRKHAGATTVEVTIEERAGFFSVRIADDGRGFEPAQALRVRPGHLGLASMNERIALAGGALRLSSTVGAGATVEITLPGELDQRIPA
jgi:signal transduction histidine kinase